MCASQSKTGNDLVWPCVASAMLSPSGRWSHGGLAARVGPIVPTAGEERLGARDGQRTTTVAPTPAASLQLSFRESVPDAEHGSWPRPVSTVIASTDAKPTAKVVTCTLRNLVSMSVPQASGIVSEIVVVSGGPTSDSVTETSARRVSRSQTSVIVVLL